MINEIETLNKKITSCKKCPRLSTYIKQVSKDKTKRFQDQKYWGKPLTGFGDTNAEILLIGLAPAAHGGNRTGRMFTGDSSGDWVAKVLYNNGYASKKTSQTITDGFSLTNVYITAVVRCAPPKNKPTKDELENCFSFLKSEFLILKNIKIIICLGHLAFERCCKLLDVKGEKFSHGKLIHHKHWKILCSYHPSRQNTQTGRLKWNQWNMIFRTAKKVLQKN